MEEGGEESPDGGKAPENSIAAEQAVDVSYTAEQLEEMRQFPRKRSIVQHERVSGSEFIVDVDRTALEAILDVGSHLRDIQKKSKVSMSTTAMRHESYDKQVNDSK